MGFVMVCNGTGYYKKVMEEYRIVRNGLGIVCDVCEMYGMGCVVGNVM